MNFVVSPAVLITGGGLVLPEGELSFFEHDRTSRTIHNKRNKWRFDFDIRFCRLNATSVIVSSSGRSNTPYSISNCVTKHTLFHEVCQANAVERGGLLLFDKCSISQIVLFF